jgi:hypothetical protein
MLDSLALAVLSLYLKGLECQVAAEVDEGCDCCVNWLTLALRVEKSRRRRHLGHEALETSRSALWETLQRAEAARVVMF